jgi:exodeoxyribonuclease VII small subunit
MMIPSGDRCMTPSPSDSLTFEKALADLERILRNLEDGTTSLEESLAQYERGVALLKGCYQHLRDAEQRILKLAGVDEEGKPMLEPFEHSASLEAAADTKPAKARSKSGETSSY